jgi:hypothetical protein
MWMMEVRQVVLGGKKAAVGVFGNECGRKPKVSRLDFPLG